MQRSSKFKYLSYLFLTLWAFTGFSCGSSERFTGFSYDPEGASETYDKEIQLQHKRTIGIREDGIWLTNEFPGARMNNFFQVNDSLYQVVIEPENEPINESPWYAFKIWADSVQTVNLKLRYKHGDHRYIPDLSRDGKNWAPIDSSRYHPDTLSGTATLQLPVSPDTLWVSAQELVTKTEFNHWADSLNKLPYVNRDTVGYSHQNRPIEKLTVSEVSDGQACGVIIIVSRLHPPEVPGNLTAFAFIEELASGSELASRFRKHFEVVAFPFANPDGVQNGHWRHNAKGVDLNRDWVAFNQPETRVIRDDLIKNVANDSLKKVYYGIDFHSTDENIFYPIERKVDTFPEDFTYQWLDKLIQAFPEIEFAIEPFDTSSPITKNWIYNTFGADAVTYEVNDTIDRAHLSKTAVEAARLMMELLMEEKEKNRN